MKLTKELTEKMMEERCVHGFKNKNCNRGCFERAVEYLIDNSRPRPISELGEFIGALKTVEQSTLRKLLDYQVAVTYKDDGGHGWAIPVGKINELLSPTKEGEK